MPVGFYWVLFLAIGAAAILAAKRLDDAERRRWADARKPAEEVET